MATITPILWTAKRDGEGRSPIYIRIQVNRQRALVSLGEKALDNEWDENRGRLKGSSDRVSIVNTIISDRVAALEREAARRKLERQPITARGLKESVSNERGAKADFFTHADLYIRHLEQQRPGHGLIHHSDRGSQYTSYEYQQMLLRAGMTISMSRGGSCHDNAPTESFFGTLKTEMHLRGDPFPSP